MHVVESCADVLPFLRGEGKFSRKLRPGLIVLDLNLSQNEDCDTLAQIKQDAQFRRIPVIVMAPREQLALAGLAYDLRANAYVTKPNSTEEFVKLTRAVLYFWLELARLPERGE